MKITLLSQLSRINYFQIFLSFCVPYWFLFILLSINTLDVFPFSAILKFLPYNLILPPLVFFIIGVIINCLLFKASVVTAKFGIFLCIMLCILDQAIKLIIVRNLDVSLPLIGNWLRIEVQFNPGHILNDRGIFFDKWIAIIIFPLSIYIYRYAVFAKQDMRFVAVTILLFVAGAICNLTDKIIYNGTYDYIWVPNFVVLDLKDLFVEIGASILLQAAISLETKRIKGAKKEKKPSYITYELNNFKRWFYRKTDR